MSSDGFKMLQRLEGAIKSLEGRYDYVIFDTPPSNGGLTRAALTYSDVALVPLPTRIKGIENLLNVSEVLANVQKVNPNLRLGAFLPTTYKKGRTQDREVLELLEEDYTQIAPVAPPITERVAVYGAMVVQRSAVGFAEPDSPAAAELNAVLDAVLEVL